MGSGMDSDEDIPMAVPVESIVNNNNNQGDTTLNKEVDTTAKEDELNTTLDTADGDEKIGSIGTNIKPPVQPTEETKSTSPTTSGKKRANSEVSADPVTSSDIAPASKKKKTSTNTADSAKKERPKACQGLTIPFRTIKRIMKIDTGVGIVQNDAAIVVTAALEHFVKELATKALKLSEKKGRGTIKYEDVAEVRAADLSLSFLDLLMP